MMNSDYLGGDFPGGGHSVRGPRTLGGAHLLLPHRRRQNSMVKRSTEMLDLLIWLYIDIKSFLKKIKLTSFKIFFYFSAKAVSLQKIPDMEMFADDKKYLKVHERKFMKNKSIAIAFI